MKNSNKYTRIKKTLWAGASTGILTGMFLMGTGNTALAETAEFSAPSYTQNTIVTGMHLMRRWNSRTKAAALADHLGIPAVEIAEELKSGKTLKQIFQEHGIAPDQLQKAFSRKDNSRKWKK